MDSEGGSTGTLLRCQRDGVETRLRCAECQTPVCPACFVRTAVGLKCQTCAATPGPPVYGIAGERRRGVVVAVVAVLALLGAGAMWAVARGSGGSGSSGDVDDASGKVVVPEVVLGTGELPGGATWRLTARRDGTVCATLLVTPGPPAPERCAPASPRPVVGLSSVTVPGPPGTPTYVTLGQVSDRVERVRVAPDGLSPWDVQTMGGGTGLGARFFVAQMTSNVAVSFTAIGADGSDLGRVTRPALRSTARP